jgi:hypothetical protein
MPENTGSEARNASDVEIESPDALGLTSPPKPTATTTRPEPLSIEVLRQRLDAAIDAEQWGAVSVIRERIRDGERADVVDLDRERARRGSKL